MKGETGAHRVDLSEFRGRFRDGWTEDDISSVLPRLSEALGYKVVAVWDLVDEYGYGGASDLFAFTSEGEMRHIPEKLWGLLCDSEGDGLIDPDLGPPYDEGPEGTEFLESDFRFHNGIWSGADTVEAAEGLQLLVPGSIVNVHHHDGSATGGYEYAGLGVAPPVRRSEPVIVLTSIDDKTDRKMPLGKVAWIDVLATPIDCS